MENNRAVLSNRGGFFWTGWIPKNLNGTYWERCRVGYRRCVKSRELKFVAELYFEFLEIL